MSSSYAGAIIVRSCANKIQIIVNISKFFLQEVIVSKICYLVVYHLDYSVVKIAIHVSSLNNTFDIQFFCKQS